MKHKNISLGLALCLAALPALGAEPGSLRGSDCLDPTMARSWIEVDSRTVLVDAGRRKYRLHIAPACTALGFSPWLGFKGDSGSGRVCGVLGDSVVTREYTCRIEGMELLDKDQYKQALASRKSARKPKPVSPSKTP